ncbi:MAG: Re/Si-specific NAD(P)(+) transhydrogenase subunit alpha [Myxococcales bacterium]|nr:Re/Si-specific NAD(P)(+) transhydrogenase subunit alpha [Myxococcales bacterium]
MTTVFVPRESHAGETRVAVTPETVDKLCNRSVGVVVEHGAGDGSFIGDEQLKRAGADIASDRDKALGAADVVLKVREPTIDEARLLKRGAVIVSMLVPGEAPGLLDVLAERDVTCFSMNLVPRITRAQKMDALSSQANIAGYKAALIAAGALPRYFPLLMTAAGTVKPAKVVVMGAGVAGLSAIATARRLGAQVWASDVRLAAKEQVESLAAKFIDVPGMEDLEDERGYAKAATPEFLERQRQIVGDHVASAHAVITTALVPGRRAPTLLREHTISRMTPGAVIVDLAAEQGGNCELTVAGESVVKHGVTIIGPRNLPATVPIHASELYARNVLAFVEEIIDSTGTLALDLEDEVQRESRVAYDEGGQS